uniref:Uncharacterized protein n=1 Tax=Anguilla anguilla TaxID=7936 RepID=A0A0E9TTN8_ANGAN
MVAFFFSSRKHTTEGQCRFKLPKEMLSHVSKRSLQTQRAAS